jgi:hypothetical protein
MVLRRLGATQYFLFPLSLPCNFPRVHSSLVDGKVQLEQNESPEMGSQQSPLPVVANCGKKYVITNSRGFPMLGTNEGLQFLWSPPFYLLRHCQSLSGACMPLSALAMELITRRSFRSRLEDSFQGVSYRVHLAMAGTAAKDFMFIDCNPVDGDQTYKRTQQSLKRSHVVRESHRQSRAKRLAALKADNESVVLPKIRSCEIGVQSIAAQPLTKKSF